MPDEMQPAARVRLVNVRRKLPPYYEGYGAAEQLGSVICKDTGMIRPVPRCPYERGTNAHHFFFIGVDESVQDHAARKKRGR